MAPEGILSLVNLGVWLVGLLWMFRLVKSARRQDSADLGVAGHYRPALYFVGLVLAVLLYLFVIQRREAPTGTVVLLAISLAGQVVALVAATLWHRKEEQNYRGRVEMYSDLSGCLLLLGVAFLTALSVVPALIVVVRTFLAGE